MEYSYQITHPICLPGAIVSLLDTSSPLIMKNVWSMATINQSPIGFVAKEKSMLFGSNLRSDTKTSVTVPRIRMDSPPQPQWRPLVGTHVLNSATASLERIIEKLVCLESRFRSSL